MLKDMKNRYFSADDEFIKLIDEYRFANQINSRSEAIRELLDFALAAKGHAPQ